LHLAIFHADNPKEEAFKEFRFHQFNCANLVHSLSKTRKINFFEPTDTILSGMQALYQKGTQRILVSQQDDSRRTRVYRLVSQMDMVKFLLKYTKELSSFLEKRICETNLQSIPGVIMAMITVDNTKETALDAFKKMWREGIHGIAVVDETGKLIGTLSSSDLRGMNATKLQYILKSPLDFLKAMTAQSKLSVSITCNPSNTLEEVLVKAVTARVHRVWIVDSAQKPVGVVSLSDIIASIVEK